MESQEYSFAMAKNHNVFSISLTISHLNTVVPLYLSAFLFYCKRYYLGHCWELQEGKRYIRYDLCLTEENNTKNHRQQIEEATKNT